MVVDVSSIWINKKKTKFSKTFLAYLNAWMVFLLIYFFIKSLAQKLKSEIAPNAIYVHCFAHCNELIVKDAIKES